MNLEILKNYINRSDCKKEFFIRSLYGLTRQYGYHKSYIRDMGYITLDKDDKNTFEHLKMLVENNIPFVITYANAIDDLKFVNNNMSLTQSLTNDGAAFILLSEFHKP